MYCEVGSKVFKVTYQKEKPSLITQIVLFAEKDFVIKNSSIKFILIDFNIFLLAN